jgi:tRNA-binding protein
LPYGLDLRQFWHSTRLRAVSEKPKPEIDATAFFAVDMRVGRIVDVARFPEARKPALKVTADFGADIGRLTTSAQITNYSSAELRGRLIVGVTNLGAKRIAGFDSQFLILGAIDEEGTVLLLSPDGDPALGDVIG